MSEDKFLSDYSPRDAVWDTQRTLTDSVGGIYFSHKMLLQKALHFSFGHHPEYESTHP